ncbi:hypothetical protein Ahy_B08g092790 [Arachis hypogaea]|uniref:Uncharacterized protein n=1 Tax=Arachis hypogaea TaxID=3818 RepID=A0A444Y4R3_ARAHY|nr:hypothetical protein Ahy_B08g092790 [Arachis hypogaea]
MHAMAAIAKRENRADTYVHKWLKMDAFRATYGHFISPFNSEDSIPPKIKRPIDRLVKRRRLDPVEDRPEGTKAKKTFKVTCEKCGEPSHNAKTYKGASKAETIAKGKVKGKFKKKSFATQEEVQVSQSALITHPEAPTNVAVPDIRMNVNAESESVSAETMAVVSSGTTSIMFKFSPTPGLNLSKKK